MSLAAVIEILGTKGLLGGRTRKMDYSLHDALTDNACWEAQYWDFHLDRLNAIKEKIQNEYASSSAGIAFSALWVGDQPAHEIEESLDSLLRRFDEGRIGTRELYIIHKKKG